MIIIAYFPCTVNRNIDVPDAGRGLAGQGVAWRTPWLDVAWLGVAYVAWRGVAYVDMV